MEGWTVKDEDSKKRFIAHIEELYAKHGHIAIQYTTAKPRTMAQNSALHLWLGQVAQTLNDAGLDMKKTLKPNVDIPWTVQLGKGSSLATNSADNGRRRVYERPGARRI
jgi:hypothetical protein